MTPSLISGNPQSAADAEVNSTGLFLSLEGVWKGFGKIYARFLVKLRKL